MSRRQEIVELIEEHGFQSVTTLARNVCSRRIHDSA